MAAVGEQTYLTDLTTSPGRIGCRLTQGTAQTGWTTSVYTTITFGTEDFDWGDLFDSATSTTKILIGKYPGLWLISGMYVPINNTATNQRIQATLNGTAINGAWAGATVNNSTFIGVPLPASLVVSTLAADYVELQGWQTGTAGTSVSGATRSAFQALFIGTQ